MKIKCTMKFGQTGLFMRVWYGKNFNNKKDILISKDYPRIFEYLGLSYERWLKGFDTLEDIFQYIGDSPYFDSDIFQMKNLNKINRERNLKRKSYMSFLEWIDNSPKYRSKTGQEVPEFDPKEVEKFFPESNLMMNIRKLEYERARKLYINSKFNGGMIIRKYSIEGSQLGKIIGEFKDMFNGGYDEYILETPQEEIFNRFERFLELYTEHKID